MQELLQHGEDGGEQKRKGGGDLATQLGMSHQHPWAARDMVTLGNTVFEFKVVCYTAGRIPFSALL